MNRDLRDRILEFIRPYCRVDNERRALITDALYSCAVIDRIDWSGNASTFSSNMLDELERFGICDDDEPAIVMILRHIGSTHGTDIDRAANELIAEIQSNTTITNDLGEIQSQPISNDSAARVEARLSLNEYLGLPSKSDLRDMLEITRNMMIEFSTGVEYKQSTAWREQRENQYTSNRSDILEALDKNQIPRLLRVSPSLSSVKQSMHSEYTTYAERRNHIREEFAPILKQLEDRQN